MKTAILMVAITALLMAIGSVLGGQQGMMLALVVALGMWRPYFLRFPRWQRMSLGYFCADLNYVMFMKRFAEPRSDEGQIEYFLGGSLTNWLAWQLPAIVGIVLADVIPTHWGLGFAGVLALLGLAYSLVSDKATGLAALIAGGAAVAAFALPFRLYIVVAIAAAVCVGLIIDGGGDAGRRALDRLRRTPRGEPNQAHREGAAA